jgi:hypothetical protein
MQANTDQSSLTESRLRSRLPLFEQVPGCKFLIAIIASSMQKARGSHEIRGVCRTSRSYQTTGHQREK